MYAFIGFLTFVGYVLLLIGLWVGPLRMEIMGTGLWCLFVAYSLSVAHRHEVKKEGRKEDIENTFERVKDSDDANLKL